MERPVLLCGLGRVGWRVFDSLRAAGLTVAVIDSHLDPSDSRLVGVRAVKGDCRLPDVLEQAGVKDARGVLILTSDDLVNISTALLVRRLNAEVRVVVRMFNQNLIARFAGAVKNTVAMSVSALVAPVMALTAVSGDTLARSSWTTARGRFPNWSRRTAPIWSASGSRTSRANTA